MVFGMFPIALATGAGARMEKWFGLGDHWWDKSLFLTLIVVPVIYEIMEKLIHKLTKENGL
jgi:HAE1 family hydrophobic/amphiphilic exporter-1